MNEYPYEFLDEKTGKVLCQVCGKPFLVISPRHLKSHDVSYSEYKLRFSEAPLSCDEFAASSKFGKDKTLFIEEYMEIEEEEKEKEETVEGSEELVKEEPSVEKVDIKKALEVPKKDPFTQAKDKILEQLRLYLTHCQKDYNIILYNSPDIASFQCISDFADPILKVNIEFPNTFWHNKDAYVDLQRNQKLMEAGWKVIEIKTKAPSNVDIDNAIKNL